MKGRLKPSRFLSFLLVVLFSSAAFAQFSASIQGVVQDSSGAGISKATIQLVNIATASTAVATSDASGNYRFVSIAPGSYKLRLRGRRFRKNRS